MSSYYLHIDTCIIHMIIFDIVMFVLMHTEVCVS